MQFRTPKADRFLSLLSLRGRKAEKTRRQVLAAEFLEPRQLLAAAGFTAASINVTAQEGTPFANTPVAQITNQPIGVGLASDYAATIDWGDGTTSAANQVATTAQSGVFQVLGSHTYAEDGSDNVRITISKDGGTASTVTATATISDPPVTASGGYTVLAVEGTAPASQLLATFIDPGGPEAASDYSATIAWGDGTSTAGTVAYNSALGAFVVTGGGTHTYTSYGTDTVTVTIKHDKAATATVTDSAVVSDPAVLAQGGFTYTASEGNTATAQTLATFTDPGGAEAAAHYSATIDWGDGNTTAGTVQSNGGGQFGVVGNHAYLEEGKGAIKIILNHDISASVSLTSAFSISDPSISFAAPPVINVNEGVLLNNKTMGTFLDPGGPEDAGDYSAQINWGDGTVSPGVVSFSVANNIYSVVGTHDYLTAGVHNTKITLHHDVAPDATLSGSVIVNDLPVVGAGGFTLAAVEGALSPNQVVATFTDPGVIGNPLTDYSANIDWGDGTSSAASGINFDSSSQIFSVDAQHTYAEEGSYPITITIGHDQATAVTVAGSARVTDPAVQAVGGATVSALEYRTFAPQDLAEFTDPGGGEPSDYSATINWGDGSISGGQIVPSGSGFSVLGSHLYTRYGTFGPTVTIHHDTAPDVSVSDTVDVGIPPIQLTALPATWREFTVPVELSPLASTSFTDTQMTAVIGWGDGSTSAGVITPDLLGTVGTVRGSHLYTESGAYLITVTVLDGGQSTSLTVPTTVMRELLPIANTNAGTPNQYYVAEVYGDVLGRAVDGGGLQYWSSLLDRGAPRAGVTNALLSSNEYLGNFVIGPAYQKYLGRAADPGGVTYWLGQMHLGLSDQGLVAALASSPEFFAKSGGTNLSFVNGLYQAVLGRPADSAGQSYWVGLLNSGISRFNVALSFAISAEDTADMVINDYQHMLGRGPSAGELNQWVTAFGRGTASNESLIATLAASDEYFSIANSE